MGSYPANKLGVFDLGGNVSEWCEELTARGRMGILTGAHVTGSCIPIRCFLPRGNTTNLTKEAKESVSVW